MRKLVAGFVLLLLSSLPSGAAVLLAATSNVPAFATPFQSATVCAGGSGAITSCVANGINLPTTTAKLFLNLNQCGSGTCSGSPTPPTITSITGANISGCARKGRSTGGYAEVQMCNITSTNSNASVTINYSGSANFTNIGAVVIDGLIIDENISNAASTTTGTISVSTNGPTTQANDFVYSFMSGVSGGSISTGSGQTQLYAGNTGVGGWGVTAQYTINNTAGVQTSTAVASDGAGGDGIIVAFKATRPAPVTGCTNTSTTTCFLLGSYGLDSGSTTWMSRPWDFSAGFIGQNQCQQFLNNGFGTYPFDGGADNPGVIGDYNTLINNNSACPNQIYSYKTQNEWWLNCNQTNPWQTNVPPIANGSCTAESSTPTVSPATYISNTCTMISAIRSAYPSIKVSWYGPTNSNEAAFDPSGSCTIDAYEVHIYIYGDQIGGRTAKGDWNGGTPYSCNPAGGANNTLPHDVQCDPNSPVGFLINWAKTHGNKPIAFTEACDGYNDNTGPGGVSYATWAISELAKANNTTEIQWWTGDPDGAGKSSCSIDKDLSNNAPLNKQAAMNMEFGGTHYAGTFYTFKAIPSPNPRP